MQAPHHAKEIDRMSIRALARNLILTVASFGPIRRFLERVYLAINPVHVQYQSIGTELPVLIPDAIDKVTTGTELQALYESPAWRARAALEDALSQAHRKGAGFRLWGYSALAGQPVMFQVHYPALDSFWAGSPNPIWRESLVCPLTKINNRRRAALALMRSFLPNEPRLPKPLVYLFEQVTDVYRYVRDRCVEVDVIGSEWLGPDIRGGTVIDGIRHEDCARLSLDSASVDVALSLDVFEHVPDPDAGFRELARVLKPGGRLIMTIPFHWDRAESTVRARAVAGEVEMMLPPEYHGNPIDPKGSLVFTDFGWDVLDRMRSAGFVDVHIQVWWSLEYGHLGRDNFLFVASRGK
jgi:SAM-dependent methyltransferase